MAITQANIDRLVTWQQQKSVMTNRSGTLAAANTSQQVAPAKPTRQYLLIQNVSNADLWVNEFVAAVMNQPSIKLAPNEKLIFDGVFCPTGAIYIIGGTSSQAYTVKEA